MKISLRVFLPFLICAVLPHPYAVSQEPSITLEKQINKHRDPMNLAELTQLALKQNPGLQAARMAIDVSEQAILAAKGEQFGRIDFEVSDFTYGDDNLPRSAKKRLMSIKKIVIP